MAVTSKVPMLLLTGNSHRELALLIADKLGLSLGDVKTWKKSNKETTVEIGESVRGKDIYIIQTGTSFSNIITMDLHQKEIQGFFNCPVDNLRASPFLIEYIKESIPDYRNAVIVARQAGTVGRATSYAERLRLSIAVIHGEEKLAESETDDGRCSPPPSSFENRNNGGLQMLPRMEVKEKPPINVVGDVSGKIAIVVDDMIDCVESFVSVASLLKDRGAYKVYVMATHGLLSADAPRLLEDSAIDEVVVTNTVPHDLQKMQCHKIKTVDVSLMLAEAIRRIHNQESMSHLFQQISSCD